MQILVQDLHFWEEDGRRIAEGWENRRLEEKENSLSSENPLPFRLISLKGKGIGEHARKLQNAILHEETRRRGEGGG